MRKLEDLHRQLSEGRITRHEFLSRAAALGVTAAVPALILQEEAMAAAPKKGGQYLQGSTGGATSDVLDPAQTLDSYMINVNFGQLRNNLTEISPSGELAPELVESWEATPDAATWRFKLRKGVEFHNGKTLSRCSWPTRTRQPRMSVCLSRWPTTGSSTVTRTPNAGGLPDLAGY